MSKKLMQLYFNVIYNPLYDLTVAQVSPYQRFQRECIDKLQFESDDAVLCVGVGTGNEIVRIMERNCDVSIVGVDTSLKALRRAYQKARRHGKDIDIFRMDAHRLELADESFDKVLCVHVMGFLEDDRTATQEIVRVLKRGGQFVITYPSGSGSIELGGEIARSIWSDLRSKRYGKAVKQCFATIIAGIAYAPGAYWVKPRQGFYSHESLKDMLDALGFRDYHIDEDRLYQDFIVYGEK
ncbi:MAG: methyltransferase domain-containing protein [Dehalococcoidia bacterium]|nr:methyltransferase domain-containing protein [Dehalococcoidia bacterium]